MDGTDYLAPPDDDYLLQRFVLGDRVDRRSLYWRGYGDGVVARGGAIHVPAGCTLSFETYFNTFYEQPWRKHTCLRTLSLRMVVSGACTVRVWRRALERRTLLAEQASTGGRITVQIGHEALNFRQFGALSVEIVTGDDEDVLWHSGGWWGEAALAQPVQLAVAVCTFNREAQLGRVLASLAADRGVCDRLARIYVVNQGKPGLRAHPAIADAADDLGDQLVVIEQSNFGGAGGFTRGLLAAMDAPDVSHVALLDDDVEVEPDSLLRMASFFAFGTADIVVGGHMLDSVQPTFLFEAGAVVTERTWAFEPQLHCCDVSDPAVLDRIGHPVAVHYNGWWCCGLPLALLRKAGLPLPMFIRGDDVELGLRLHAAGIPTVPVPGIAVWHEPFYLKLGSWQLYYETRNLLVAAALHLPADAKGVTRRMARHLFTHLLTVRYYSAALIIRGIADYLAGPAVLERPQALHAELAAYRQAYPASVTGRGRVLYPQPGPARLPKTRAGFLRLMGRIVWQQWWTPTRTTPPRSMPVTHLGWTMMQGVDHIALETWWDDDRPTLHRSREAYRTLAVAGLRMLWRLYREQTRAAGAWRAAFPALVSVEGWRRYLGLAEVAVAIPEIERVA